MKHHTQDEFQTVLRKVWKRISRNKILNLDKPQAYVLGGQPAAGKSGLSRMIENKLDANVITINGDDYRKYHKKYHEFQEKYGQDASQYTGEFSGKMTEALIRKAASEKYNLIIEGTFRTAETPLKTLQGLKDLGYSTHVAIQTCPKELSLISTKSRYFIEEYTNKGFGRMTPEAHHNLTVDTLAQNAEKVFNAKIADTFYVQSRDGVLYDSTLTQAPFKAEIIQKELNRGAEQEINTMKEQLMELYPKEIVAQIFLESSKQSLKKGDDVTIKNKSDIKKKFKEALKSTKKEAKSSEKTKNKQFTPNKIKL